MQYKHVLYDYKNSNLSNCLVYDHGRFFGLTRGSKFYDGLYPIYNKMFMILLRTAMLNLWYEYKIILLEKALNYKHNNMNGEMDFYLYRIYMWSLSLLRPLVGSALTSSGEDHHWRKNSSRWIMCPSFRHNTGVSSGYWKGGGEY